MSHVEQRAQAFRQFPCNQFFGYEFISRSAEHAEVAQPVRPEHAQGEGIVHGGIITALADSAGVYAIYPDLPPSQTMTSIELKLNFLRPALTDGGDLRARARVVKQGRTIAVCDVEVEQNGWLVAKGLFTYLILADG